jgi:hypothetical protein
MKTDCDGNVEIDDYSGNPPARMSLSLRDSRKVLQMEMGILDGKGMKILILIYLTPLTP